MTAKSIKPSEIVCPECGSKVVLSCSLIGGYLAFEVNDEGTLVVCEDDSETDCDTWFCLKDWKHPIPYWMYYQHVERSLARPDSTDGGITTITWYRCDTEEEYRKLDEEGPDEVHQSS